MERYSGVLLAHLLVQCLTGCAPMQPYFPQVQLPPRPIVQQGYSVVPLNEPGWIVVRRTLTHVALARPGRNPDETIAIDAQTFELKPQSMLDDVPLLRKGIGMEASARFKLVSSNVTPAARAGCEQRHVVVEDRMPVRRSGAADAMILESIALVCAHPRTSGLGVALVYSHRYEPGGRDGDFEARAASVLGSLQFTDR